MGQSMGRASNARPSNDGKVEAVRNILGMLAAQRIEKYLDAFGDGVYYTLGDELG